MNKSAETIIIYRYIDVLRGGWRARLEHWAGEPGNSFKLGEKYFDTLRTAKAHAKTVTQKRPWINVVVESEGRSR